MNLLITGGTGALGRALLERIAPLGATVTIASRRPPPDGLAPHRWAPLDLATGEGLEGALEGMGAVVHAASDARRSAQVDVAGSARLLAAARRAGVGHLLYVSIVGIDRIPFGYYRSKLQVEEMTAESGIPHTILRATQFHSFIDQILRALARAPGVLPLPRHFQVQSVEIGEVAGRIVRALREGPGGRLRDLGGPEILRVEDAAAEWQRARGLHRRMLRVPVPGALAAAFRAGHNTAPGGDRGQLRWSDWLRRETRGGAAEA